MYEKALATNHRLKSRLETSKQELAMIQDQLQRTQVEHIIITHFNVGVWSKWVQQRKKKQSFQ